MFTGIIGVVIGYVILISLLIWFMIFSKGRLILKAVAIMFSVYYAIGLYTMLPNMEGWPTSQDIPEGSNVISIRIVEPSGSDPGAFYLWCNTNPDQYKQAVRLLRPSDVFIYDGGKQPRAFKIPYDRELHKKITEAQKQKKKMGGWIQVVKGDKKGGKKSQGGDERQYDKKIDFKIINPVEILTKPTSE